MDSGIEQRLQILRRDAEEKVLDPLRAHGWRAQIIKESAAGDGHLVMQAQRAECTRTIGLLYSSASSNSTYKNLEQEVDLILANGGLYHIESFAHGVKIPIRAAEDFFEILVEWNQASSNGKFAPDTKTEVIEDELAEAREPVVLLSETPIEAVWLRIRQLQSVRLAQKLVIERASSAGASIDASAAATKAEGIAFSLRNASDYYHAVQGRTVSQRVLNLYYGSMAFVFAEMLSDPQGPVALAEIEQRTKQGHGLYMIDGRTAAAGDLVVGVLKSGLFPFWMKILSRDADWCPTAKPKSADDLARLPDASWVTLEQLFARIPEIGDLFRDVFESPALWLSPRYDEKANLARSFKGPPSHIYAILTDTSGRLTREDVATFPGPISEISVGVSHGSTRSFRVAVNCESHKSWWDALDLYSSPFVRSSLIKPLFREVSDHRCICFVLLYALSIIVRYRPSIWRRIQEGDLDHLRVVIEAFLSAAERVLPDQFLARVLGARLFVNQPGAFSDSRRVIPTPLVDSVDPLASPGIECFVLKRQIAGEQVPSVALPH
jgi:hypothetical protein